MPLRTFDPMQPLDAYRSSQDRRRVASLQDYQQGRQVEADRRSDVAYQREEEARPGLERMAQQQRDVKTDKTLTDFGNQQLVSLNPDSETFEQDKQQIVVDFTNKMHGMQYSPQQIEEHGKRMFTNMTPDNVRYMQEKAGMRRPPAAVKPIDPLKAEKLATLKKGEAQADRDTKFANEKAISAIDESMGTIDRMLEGEGLEKATGFQSNFPTASGTDAANFEAMLETFQSQAFLTQIKQMKGMGALSENEGKKLAASVGSLSTTMSDKALRKELGRIKDTMSKAKENMRRKFGMTEPAEVPKAINFGDL